MGLGGYERLLHSLASRRTAASDVALFKVTQIFALAENPLLQLNKESAEQPVVHQYAPPIVAPMQEAQVFTEPIIGGTSQQRKRCVYYPYCKLQARSCGRTHRNRCKNVVPNGGQIEVPTWELLQKEKQKIINAERATQRKAEQEHRRKQQTATTTQP